MASVRVRFRVRDIGVNIAGHLYLRLGVTIASALLGLFCVITRTVTCVHYLAVAHLARLMPMEMFRSHR